MLLSAVECGTLGLGDLSLEYLTEEICLAGVRRRGTDLRFIPDEMKTVKICEAACRLEWVLMFVPRELILPGGLLNRKIKTEQELLEEYSTEELLTSKNAYLRELGKRVLK